jgi:hypothetical protein
MVAGKLPRLWLGPARGEGRTPTLLRLWHGLLVLAAFAGIVAGRNRTMLAVLVAFTLFHLLAGAMPRYALPLLPALVATGCAGWAQRWLDTGGADRLAPSERTPDRQVRRPVGAPS